MRKLLCILVFCCSSLIAGQSWSPSGSQAATYTWPNTTWSAYRLEFRIHAFTLATGTAQYIQGMGTQYCRLNASDDNLFCGSWKDSRDAVISLTGRTDVVVRYQRDPSAGIHRIEVWNADGSGYATAAVEITDSTDPWTQTGESITIGEIGWSNLYFGGDIAWLRIYSTAATVGVFPNVGGTGDALSLEFEGNLNDSSGNGRTHALSSGSGSYATTPALAPSANAGADTTMRAAAGGLLDGTASFSEGIPTYTWEQTAGPTTATIDVSSSTVQPTLRGLIAGQYTFQLTVTDGAQNSTDTVNVGVVVADSAGRITLPSASVAAVLGPQLMIGASPWTWFDNRHKALGDFFGGLQAADPAFVDDWNEALAGTCGIANGGSTVTCIGSSLQSDFCSGGATPDTNAMIVLWYPLGADTGRYPFEVAGCTSQTEITVYGTAPFAVTAGASYGKMASYGSWISGSTNSNYYDNVEAFYSLYYRTGLTLYRDYARTLADRWWTMPWIDKCEPYTNQRNSMMMAPRLVGLTGMMLRALDGQSGMWVELEGCIDYSAGRLNAEISMYDIREQAYEVSMVALGAMFDTNFTKRATYIAALEHAIADNWAPNQEAAGNWHNPSYGYASWNGYAGTITVTHGSTAIVGEGTEWDTSWFDGSPFWVPGDPVAYIATWNSATSLTLDRPYEGTTRSGEGWQTSNLVGAGTQPFMMGIVGRAWYYAYQALDAVDSASAPTARQFVLDSADWITDYGYSPTVKGLYYGVDYPSCPTPETSPGCGPDASRYTTAEVMGAYSAAYALTGDSKYKSQGDILFGGEWGGPLSVGPEADGTYVTEYADGGWTFATKKAKNFGFGFGYGGATTWPAARLGTSSPATGAGISLGGGSISGYVWIQP